MKRIRVGTILIRDKVTETFVPFLTKQLARLVFFPDGKNLLDKWKEQVDPISNAAFSTSVANSADGSSFRWNCIKFANAGYHISIKVRRSIANTPTSIAYNGSKTINRYRFEIPLPFGFVPSGYSPMYDDAAIIVQEGNSSHFRQFNATHQVVAHYSGSQVIIDVHHYPADDNKSWSDYSQITGEFSIVVQGAFSKGL